MKPRAAILILAAVAAPAPLTFAAPLLETARVSMQSGGSSPIGEHALWNDACRAFDPPVVSLERSAGHGTICIRRDIIMLTQSRSGRAVNCVGAKLGGVQVVYRPQPGFVGVDTLRYGLAFPESLLSREIAIEVQPRIAARSAPSSEPGALQATGRVPECANESS